MSFFSDQAKQFQELATSIQARISSAGSAMDDTTRSNLEDRRDGLLDQANKMVLSDVQATLEQLKIDQPRLAACTASLNKAVKNVKTFGQVVAIGTAAFSLATAIASANPGAIVKALGDTEKAVTDALGKPDPLAKSAAANASSHGSDAGTLSALAASQDDPDAAG
jgi:hypothetical protein